MHNRLITLLFSIWLLLLAAGYWLLVDYGLKAGADGATLEQWPAEAALVRAEERPTLLLAIHPHCPCSYATVAELERLMPQIQHEVKLIALVMIPEEGESGWADAPLIQEFKRLPNSHLYLDVMGREAERFSLRTSGECLLFSAQGERLFQGGLTASRGHEGVAKGQKYLIEKIKGQGKVALTSPVFGCPLQNKE